MTLPWARKLFAASDLCTDRVETTGYEGLRKSASLPSRPSPLDFELATNLHQEVFGECSQLKISKKKKKKICFFLAFSLAESQS